jgi:hypothetical protein
VKFVLQNRSKRIRTCHKMPAPAVILSNLVVIFVAFSVFICVDLWLMEVL